jgi:hypothetical protein
LRFPVLPGGPLISQVCGAVAVVVGVYMQWGGPIALVVGGVAGTLAGMLREAGKV